MIDVAVVTSTRADYGTMRPVIRRLLEPPNLSVRVLVTGTHLARSHGYTVDRIVGDGFPISDRIDLGLDDSGDRPYDTAEIMGRVHAGFARSFAAKTPDLLIIDGDRTEILAVASTALPFRIPVAHLHGGEATFGAIDELCRHAITKLSHLHFAAAEPYGERIRQMGEEPWRVHVTGAPALDNLVEATLLTVDQIQARLDFRFEGAPLLITYHPETLTGASAGDQIGAMLEALAKRPEPMIFTAPNADTDNLVVRRKIQEFVAVRPNTRFVENLGTELYWSVMAIAAAMVGNTSSGINEAPSVGVPVVNIGERQRGRMRSANILDVPCEAEAIAAAIGRALSPEFGAVAQAVRSPYGDGHASERIAAIVADLPPRQHLLIKTFADLPQVVSV